MSLLVGVVTVYKHHRYTERKENNYRHLTQQGQIQMNSNTTPVLHIWFLDVLTASDRFRLREHAMATVASTGGQQLAVTSN